MLVQFGNWSLSKAGKRSESDTTLPVRMVANRLVTDRENEEILPEAFNKATVDNFVQNGVIDWHHQSVMGGTPEARALAILGRPYEFAWEDNLPVVYAELTKAHGIVRDSIAPHVEAGNPVFGCSVGGSVKKARQVWDDSTSRMKRQISGIHWDHLAIAGRPYVICPGTEISMVKALMGGSGAELLVRFSDLSEFEAQSYLLENEMAIRKALEVGAVTDSAQATGLDAMRTQSLEGAKDPKKKKARKLVEGIVKAIKTQIIYPSQDGLKLFLKAEGYSEQEAEAFVTDFCAGLPEILKKEGAQ